MPELKIIPIGPYVLDEMHQINTFFITTKTYKILYDLVPIQFYEKFREELMSQSKIEEIDYLVLSNSHSSILNVMERLIQDGYKGVIISNHFFSRQIENVYQNIQVKSLKSLDFILMDGKEVVFEFIPVVFLPYPKMFLSYMPLTETLFSNTIFSSYIHLDDPDNPWFGFDRFHENMMPSSHFLHIPLRLIKEKRIQTIYPLYGKGYEIYEIDQVLEHLHSIQFYNQSQPYEEEGGLGQKPLVKFQTLEYLRAFTTGRIGWSRLRSLLIISGAFGMFDRQTLIEAGGYLTSSSKMKKDTVGEDMELVVRLTRIALEQKKEFIVTYVHQANCYTELPSDFKTLLKQRNRWHRGLLDILSYHRKMIFDYRYKQPGMIGFPYFMIFEMMGPFIEVMGYLALVIGFMIGILNIEIFLLLFSVTIGLGMMISLFSLYIAEKDMKFYSMKETMVLIMIAILENFGYRQMISLHRVISTFSALRDSGSWGTQKRQGFKKV